MSDSHDDMLKRAEKLKQRTEANKKDRKRKHKRSTFGQAEQNIKDIHETYTSVTGTIGWLYQNVISPVFTHPWVGKPFQWYRALWERVVNVKDKDGDDVFSKQRAGTMVIATLIGLYLLPAFIGGTVEFVWDTGRMATTYKYQETWYLGKSQEIDAKGNVFSAQGCESIRCTDQTSIYFRIKPSVAHHLWSLYHNKNIFFPDYVAAGIQNDINKCKVTGYGVRWKFLVRNWDVYPQILSVDCAPLTEAEIRKAEEGVADGL